MNPDINPGGTGNVPDVGGAGEGGTGGVNNLAAGGDTPGGGATPGYKDFWNEIAKKYGDDVAEKFKVFGDDGKNIISRYGDDAANVVRGLTGNEAKEAIELMNRYGDDAVELFKQGEELAEVRTVLEGGKNTSWYKPDGTMNYPPNNGAVAGTEVNMSLQPGDTFGRYGNIGEKSNFVTQTGADASKLSLPPTTDPAIYQEFVVLKEIPNVVQAEIAAWGNSPGGGLQYELPMPILQLIKEGYIMPK